MNEHIDYLPTDGISVEGKVTIELYNADGSLAQKQEKKNYVKIQNLELMAEIYSRKDVSNTESGSILTANNNMLNGVVLMGGWATNFDSNPAIDKTDYGEMIGWANLGTASASDTVRGTFNAVESSTSPIFRRMVWDFSTSQANGQITDIYVGTMNSENTLGFVECTTIPSPVSPWHFLKVADGMMYFLTRSGALTIINKLGWGDGITRSTHQIPVSNITDFDIYDGRLWIANGTNNITVVRTTSPTVIERTINAGAPAVFGIVRRNVAPGWYLIPQFSTSSITRKVSEDFQLLDSRTLPVNLWTDGTSSFRSGPDNIILGGFIMYLQEDMSILTSRRVRRNTDVGIGAAVTLRCVDYSDNITILHQDSLSDNRTLSICTPANFFSRAKLSTPINKTVQQTMKIIYEYNFPDLTFSPRGS